MKQTKPQNSALAKLTFWKWETGVGRGSDWKQTSEHRT